MRLLVNLGYLTCKWSARLGQFRTFPKHVGTFSAANPIKHWLSFCNHPPGLKLVTQWQIRGGAGTMTPPGSPDQGSFLVLRDLFGLNEPFLAPMKPFYVQNGKFRVFFLGTLEQILDLPLYRPPTFFCPGNYRPLWMTPTGHWECPLKVQRA